MATRKASITGKRPRSPSLDSSDLSDAPDVPPPSSPLSDAPSSPDWSPVKPKTKAVARAATVKATPTGTPKAAPKATLTPRATRNNPPKLGPTARKASTKATKDSSKDAKEDETTPVKVTPAKPPPTLSPSAFFDALYKGQDKSKESPTAPAPRGKANGADRTTTAAAGPSGTSKPKASSRRRSTKISKTVDPTDDALQTGGELASPLYAKRSLSRRHDSRSPVASSSRQTLDSQASSPAPRRPRFPSSLNFSDSDDDDDMSQPLDMSRILAGAQAQKLKKAQSTEQLGTSQPSPPRSATTLPEGVEIGQACAYREGPCYMPGLLAEFIPGSPGNKVKDVYVIETQLGTVRKQRNRVLFIVEEEIADCVLGELRSQRIDRPRTVIRLPTPELEFDPATIVDSAAYRDLEFADQLITIRPHLADIINERYPPAQWRIDKFYLSSKERRSLDDEVRVADLSPDDHLEVLDELLRWALRGESSGEDVEAQDTPMEPPTDASEEAQAPPEPAVAADHSMSGGDEATPAALPLDESQPLLDVAAPAMATERPTRPAGSDRYESLPHHLRKTFIEIVLLPEAIVAMCVRSFPTEGTQQEQYDSANDNLKILSRDAEGSKWSIVWATLNANIGLWRRRKAQRLLREGNMAAEPELERIRGQGGRLTLKHDYRALNGDAPIDPVKFEQHLIQRERKREAQHRRAREKREAAEAAKASSSQVANITTSQMTETTDDAVVAGGVEEAEAEAAENVTPLASQAHMVVADEMAPGPVEIVVEQEEHVMDEKEDLVGATMAVDE